MSKPALGRGLGALLGGMPAQNSAPVRSISSSATDTPEAAVVRMVPLTAVQPCSQQPRKAFGEEALRELADSIREQGIVQPLIVRRRGEDAFELVAGERRWRAARIAGLTEIPVLVREADDREALELALIENLQRENLNPMEEAHGFAGLIEQFQLTQEEAAVRVGKGRVVVANALRLLKLAPEVQAFVRDGRLSVGHAKAILGLATHAEQQLAAARVLRQSMTVRQSEEMVAGWQPAAAETPRGSSSRGAGSGDLHVQRIQDRIRERVGTKVQVRYRQGKGSIQIQFFSDDDLERVLEVLGVSAE
jgi:ParB family transcriptional regulator, chromosome partitioning protein